MKKYEIVLLIDPTIEDAEIEGIFESIQGLLKAQGAEIIEGETINWGKKKLAYPVAKKGNGWYRVYRFNSDPNSIAEIERRLRIDERVLRSLLVLYDPDTERVIKPAESRS
ncbi:MAG TPA: 30S ribosomal protein S6 [Candidatus Glassbacteria bacterium]|nr:30S ribosomal protein S6 [Candidatus Glassbacteria bacterium]